MIRKAVFLVTLLVPLAASAASDAAFPKGWDKWPVQKSGAIPGNKTPIPASAAPILKETIKTYNWVQDGKGSAYNVRINPEQMDAYKKRDASYGDKPTGVLELTDIKVLLVTEHLLGEPRYGAYTYDGKDMSGAHASLGASACKTCHTGYGEACVTGICTK